MERRYSRKVVDTVMILASGGGGGWGEKQGKRARKRTLDKEA